MTSPTGGADQAALRREATWALAAVASAAVMPFSRRAAGLRGHRAARDAATDMPAAAWPLVPVLAEAHGLAVCAEKLAAAAPPRVAAALRDLERRTAARSRRLAVDRRLIDRRLAERGLAGRWLKGAWLADRRPAQSALRPSADLDMWVDQGDMAAVAAALESLGYAPAGRTWKHARYLRPSNAKVVDVRGEHPDNPRPVEIHPRVVESFRGIAFDLTDRLDASGQTVGDAPMVLHLVAHATVDALSRRCRLVQLLDIAQLAPTLSRADWERLGRMAEEDPRFAWPALALAAAWLAAPVPEDLLARLEASVSARLRAWVARADPDGISRLGRDRARRPLLEVPTMWPQSHAERLRVWRYILWPSRDELADRDPESPNAPKWPRQYWRHMVYNGRLMARRLRQR